MTLIDLQPDICMERPSLDGLPALAMPEGFTVRSIGVDEGHYWEAVMDSAHGGHYPPGDFQIVMVENYDYDPSRVFVMFAASDEPVATASSWRQHWRWGPGVGYLLFVAVARPYQGRGLAYWIALSVLHDFSRHGLNRSILETSDTNLPAIKTYLKLGYVPRLVHPNQGKRWEKIFQALGMQPVRYSPLLRPPIDAPHPPRPYPYELRMQNAGGDSIGDTPFELARQALGERVTLMGILEGTVFHAPQVTAGDLWALLDRVCTPGVRQGNFLLILAADGLPTPLWKFQAVAEWMERHACR